MLLSHQIKKKYMRGNAIMASPRYKVSSSKKVDAIINNLLFILSNWNEISDDDYVARARNDAKVTRLWDLDKNEKKIKKNFFFEIFFLKFSFKWRQAVRT